MSFEALLIHRVTIRWMTPATSRDDFGNRDLEPDDETETVDARIEQPDASEDLRDRDLQRERFLVFLRPPERAMDGDVELDWLDQGITLKAEGNPLECYDGVGLHHLEVNAYRMTG